MQKNDINLQDHVANITGGAQGIGYAIASRFLLSGALFHKALRGCEPARRAGARQRHGPRGEVDRVGGARAGFREPAAPM
jgi:NAD(P)-dependent dehydrogenase (short-subunit alcohol dehydrogenase family)